MTSEKINLENNIKNTNSVRENSSKVVHDNINENKLEQLRATDQEETQTAIEEIRDSMKGKVIKDLKAEIDTPTSQAKETERDESNSTILKKIRNNKWIRRGVFASVLAGGLLLPNKSLAQVESSKPKMEQKDGDIKNQEELREEYVQLFKKFINYNKEHPESSFMEKGDFGNLIRYGNENLPVPSKDADGNYTHEKPVMYSINMFATTNNRLMNFDILTKEDAIITQIRYNKQLTGDEIFAVKYSLEEQEGFEKMTANEFQNKYKILEMAGDASKGKDKYYVWVDSSLETDLLLNNTLKNLNDPSIYPDYEDDVFRFGE